MSNGPLADQGHLALSVDLLSSTTVVAVFYTLVFILYCLSVRLSYTQLRDDQGKIKRHTVYTMIFQTVLLICATLDVIVRNRVAQILYINNSDLFGGTLTSPAPPSIDTFLKLTNAVTYIENILILGVLLWRVRVVWSGTRFMMPLTVLSSFFYIVVAGLAIAYYVMGSKTGFSSLEETPRVRVILYIMLDTFTLAGSIIMTLAIIARLLLVRRKHIKVMGKSDIADQYWGIAAMLIESYALETLWGIGTAISFSLKYTPSDNLFNNCMIQVDILSNFLLVYRVLSGRAWTRQTQERLSTLRWASIGAVATTPGTIDLVQTNVVEEDPRVICSRNDM